MNNITEVCEHCGQELKKASEERKEISETQSDNIDKVGVALEERNLKVDAASEELLAIVQRIEESLHASVSAKDAIKELEAKIRARIVVENRRDDMMSGEKSE